MNSSTSNTLPTSLFLRTLLGLFLLVGWENNLLTQPEEDPQWTLIQRYRNQIERLQDQLTDANREIARLMTYIEDMQRPEAFLEEEPKKLLQQVYWVRKKLETLQEETDQPTRSDETYDLLSRELQDIALKVRGISDSFWELKQQIPPPGTVTGNPVERFEPNRHGALIQDSFRMYYSSGPGPSSRLIKLTQAPSREVKKVFFEFNVLENSHDYFVTLVNQDNQPHPDLNYQQVGIKRNRAGMQKYISMAPGKYTVWVGVKGHTFPCYTFFIF
ncbi:MAG: hypothetical protein AAF694_04580 [Bacteroidota bacterium]